MTTVDDLVAWLRLQLDEDERVAQKAIADNDGEASWAIEQPGPDEPSWRKPRLLWLNVMDSTDPESMPPGMAEHIARWDPARVLAEVETKRRVLAQYEAVRDEVRHPVSVESRTNARARQFQLEELLPLLALPYADRPGYREEWRP